MIIPRREFLRFCGLAAGAGMAGCDRLWSVPDRLVDLALRGPGLESHLQSVCGLCEGGCGLTVRLVDGLPVGLKGNVLTVEGLDAIEGTPILDVKPYFPRYDRVDEPTTPEWVDRIMTGYF